MGITSEQTCIRFCHYLDFLPGCSVHWVISTFHQLLQSCTIKQFINKIVHGYSWESGLWLVQMTPRTNQRCHSVMVSDSGHMIDFLISDMLLVQDSSKASLLKDVHPQNTNEQLIVLLSTSAILQFLLRSESLFVLWGLYPPVSFFRTASFIFCWG